VSDDGREALYTDGKRWDIGRFGVSSNVAVPTVGSGLKEGGIVDTRC
jgi:hypothetical protein